MQRYELNKQKATFNRYLDDLSPSWQSTRIYAWESIQYTWIALADVWNDACYTAQRAKIHIRLQRLAQLTCMWLCDNDSSQWQPLMERIRDIHQRKNAGYAGQTGDAWSNFRECEAFGIRIEDGIITRMSDKVARIRNLLRNPNNEQVGESLDDTMLDLGIYALILRSVLDETYEADDE